MAGASFLDGCPWCCNTGFCAVFFVLDCFELLMGYVTRSITMVVCAEGFD